MVHWLACMHGYMVGCGLDDGWTVVWTDDRMFGWMVGWFLKDSWMDEGLIDGYMDGYLVNLLS